MHSRWREPTRLRLEWAQPSASRTVIAVTGDDGSLDYPLTRARESPIIYFGVTTCHRMEHQALSRRARSSPRCKAVSGVFSIVRKRPSALTLRRGRVVGADVRNLFFVHHVPSNSEEHEKDSDYGPKYIDAGHQGMKRRCELIGNAFCCCEVTVGVSHHGHGNRSPRPELRRCGRKTLRPHTPSYLAPLRWGLLSCVFRGRNGDVRFFHQQANRFYQLAWQSFDLQVAHKLNLLGNKHKAKARELGSQETPVLTSPNPISTLLQRFACARLSQPCLPGSSAAEESNIGRGAGGNRSRCCRDRRGDRSYKHVGRGPELSLGPA